MYTALYETTPKDANILELTISMYAIAIKLVIPARISVFTFEPCSFTLKNFSIV